MKDWSVNLNPERLKKFEAKVQSWVDTTGLPFAKAAGGSSWSRWPDADSISTIRARYEKQISALRGACRKEERALFSQRGSEPLTSLQQVDLWTLGYEDGSENRSLDRALDRFEMYRTGWMHGLRWYRDHADKPEVPGGASERASAERVTANIWMAKHRSAREWALKIRSPSWVQARAEAMRAWQCGANDVDVRPYDPGLLRMFKSGMLSVLGIGAIASLVGYMLTKKAEQ